MRNILFAVLAVCAFAACRSDNSSNIDAPKGGGSDAPAGGGDAAAADPCMGTYTTSTTAAMRQGTPGCYELDNVVVLAATSSKTSPTLYVQDSTGGMYSAVEVYCDSGSTTHPCPVGAAAHAVPVGDKVTVKGTYIRSSSTHYEEFYLYAITDGGAGTLPTPGTATAADIERGATNYALAFQKVTASLTAPLKMYDWSPAEFVRTATACPYVFGFGMIPTGTSGVTEGSACSSNTAQPTGQASPNSAEVLFDTKFFVGFTTSTDCRCAGTYSDMEPTTNSTLTGSVSGILLWEVPFGATAGFTAIAPTSTTDANISMLQAGM